MASNIGQGTEKLYYEDAYMHSFDAVVLSCRELCRKGNPDAPPRYAVVLDRTAFFPEEGGQCPDRGKISRILGSGSSCEGGSTEEGSGFPEPVTEVFCMASVFASVRDVQIHEGVITHVLDRPFEPGERVHGEVDFEYRFSNMQQHSAEHLISGLVWNRLGFRNVGFHLSASEVTTDYAGVISEETMAELEWEVNRAIWKNFETEIWYPTEEELTSIEYRSKIEIDGQVRLVVYPGYDVCACCAPHVTRTGEIGLFKVVAAQKYKGGTRVFMLAGDRAYDYLLKEHQAVTKTARFLSTQTELVPERVESMKQEIADLKRELSNAEAALLAERIAAIPASEEDVCLFTSGLDNNVIRKAVNELMEKHSGVCGIFDGRDGEGYRYILGSADAQKLTAVQNEMRAKLAARGGGKPPMMQGSVPAAAAKIKAVIKALDRV